jgi:hypothetical protein
MKLYLGPGSYELNASESTRSATTDVVKVSHQQYFNNIRHVLFALFFFVIASTSEYI